MKPTDNGVWWYLEAGRIVVKGWQESTDPLYKSIPFFMGLRHGAAYGIFFDNAYRSSFDFGVEASGVLSFGADGGELLVVRK